MVHGSITRNAPADGAVVALVASVALAIASTALLLATPQLLQLLQFPSLPGLAPL